MKTGIYQSNCQCQGDRARTSLAIHFELSVGSEFPGANMPDLPMPETGYCFLNASAIIAFGLGRQHNYAWLTSRRE